LRDSTSCSLQPLKNRLSIEIRICMLSHWRHRLGTILLQSEKEEHQNALDSAGVRRQDDTKEDVNNTRLRWREREGRLSEQKDESSCWRDSGVTFNMHSSERHFFIKVDVATSLNKYKMAARDNTTKQNETASLFCYYFCMYFP
jgi:hypothetical protein